MAACVCPACTASTGASGAAAAVAAMQEPRLQAEYISAQVMSSISTILGHEVDTMEPLTAAGLDSLGAVELRNSLEEDLGMSLPATLLFDYPTAQDINAFLQVYSLSSSGSATCQKRFVPRPACWLWLSYPSL